MHPTLTNAGFPPGQADAVVKVMQGGVVTKHDLDAAVVEMRSESKRLDGKIQLILIVAIIGVLAPAATRLIPGA